MSDALADIIERYSTCEQLIQDGIWQGSIYDREEIVPREARAWIWKTITNDFRPKVLLVSVPANHTALETPTNFKSSKVDPQNNLRKLTPNWVSTNSQHPLVTTNPEQDVMANSTFMSMKETLELIDLDLSRLLIHEIFRSELVRSEMELLMYSYLLENQSRNYRGELQFAYKQGFHEILAVIYLQLHGEQEVASSRDTLLNILSIYTHLMNQVAPIFYDEENLIQWDDQMLGEIMKLTVPNLYHIFFTDKKHSNLIWLIRWTRLLFLRELPWNTVLLIWDHLLTMKTRLIGYMACLVFMIILCNYKEIHELDPNECDDIIEFMLHLKGKPSTTRVISSVELCIIAGQISDLWYAKDFFEMKRIISTFLFVHFNVPMERLMQNMDPHRTKMEHKLRQRVMRRLPGHHHNP